jgi:hypothetical protein
LLEYNRDSQAKIINAKYIKKIFELLKEKECLTGFKKNKSIRKKKLKIDKYNH